MDLKTFGIISQAAAVLINLVTAGTFLYAKRDPGLALAFFSYSIACSGYIWSIVRGG